ncbi:MAG TPA: S41 family peptidase [Terriglobales bacterium]|nr:S41 family peptidase [Terriglobales bacterium]
MKEYDPENSADGLTGFSNQTGGFTLVSIEHSAPEKLTFRVHGRGDNVDAYGVLQLASTTPPRVKRLNIRALPPGAKLDDIQLDAATRQKTIEAITEKLTEYYVYPDVAAKMIANVEDHEKKGDYNSITDGYEFADALASDLRAVSHDQHLHVSYDPFTMPAHGNPAPGPHEPSAAEQERFRSMLEQQNCTFSKVEILDHNIGYVKFGAFPPPEFCGPTVVAAMNFVAHTSALIFDLRDNHGGSPDMVDFMVSYMFPHATHINDLSNRHDNETRQFWTLPWVPGSRFADQPVYVLTSHSTFSGAEEFTFDLKTQKRATIVGETTGGGAHPVEGLLAGDHFSIGVPFARAINPVTKGDWEGTGVEPDVKVSAADALTTAEKLAAEKLSNKGKPE